jgi:membrane-bound inhibitor of C-type lysozyme
MRLSLSDMVHGIRSLQRESPVARVLWSHSACRWPHIEAVFVFIPPSAYRGGSVGSSIHRGFEMQNMIGSGLNSPDAFAGSLALGHAGDVRRRLARFALLCFVVIVPVSSAFAAEASYRCSDGTAVHAVFRGLGQAGSVRLTFPERERSITMPQVPSADGGRYRSGNTQFWIKGNTARLTRRGATTECRTDPSS